MAVGNPPFVRFQFVDDADKASLDRLALRLGTSFGGVSNLWIPVFLGALSRLRAGGAFAFIVPTECLTGVSAGTVRARLAETVDHLRLDLFSPGSFPGVLQEVLIVSGQIRATRRTTIAPLEVIDHDHGSTPRSWQYLVPIGSQTWTRYLLDPGQLEALEHARSLPAVRSLGETATFQVAAVTGANDFFSVDTTTSASYELSSWVRPLLPRIRNAAGLRYTSEDHSVTARGTAKAWLLHLTEEIGLTSPGLRSYLDIGEAQGIALRYKCRIRTPWYAVPNVRAAPLMLSKRSHRYPRMVLNEAQVVTTDTIYRGVTTPGFVGREHDIVASFHNSLTLLTAEVEGRSFGGGVLELVPSEIRRLSLPVVEGFGVHLGKLDRLARDVIERADTDPLVERTDELLVRSRIGLTFELLDALRSGRELLLSRRLDRNGLQEASTSDVAARSGAELAD